MLTGNRVGQVAVPAAAGAVAGAAGVAARFWLTAALHCSARRMERGTNLTRICRSQRSAAASQGSSRTAMTKLRGAAWAARS
jgi:hypothetical protein